MRIGAILLVLAAIGGCSKPAPPLPPADGVYATRGVVERPQARNDDHLIILHEEIGDFVNADGKPAVMQSMSMPFAVARGVDLSGVKTGSKLKFTFEMRWTGDEPLMITALEVLPDDTPLQLD